MEIETNIIPTGWANDLLDKIAERGSGHTPDKEVPEYWHGGIKWISLKDSNKLDRIYISETEEEISQEGIKNSSAVLYPPGVVVLSRDAGVGKSAITTQDMAVSQHFIAWRCTSNLNNHYLYYWLQLIKPEFERIAVGSTIKTIGLPYFKKLRIIYPILMKEQIMIAEILMHWDHAIDLTTQLITMKQQHKQGLIQQLLTGRRRFPQFTDPWQNVKIGKFLSESRIGGSDGRTARKITVKLYGKGVLPQKERNTGSEATRYYQRRAGQFIYSKLDFLNGAFGIIPPEMDGYESTLDLPCFDFKGIVLPQFFLYFVSREYFYSRFTAAALGGRKARRIQVEEFLTSEIKVPKLEEQELITTLLSNYDHELTLLNRKLALLKKQKQGLMQQLLTGKVRVKV